ncbi:MAG: GH36-type glycosyl hydrolase domain-containing protein [Agathobacter sp.]
MKGYQYLNDDGTFILQDPEQYSYLYFPMANEAGILSSITPDLGGDIKCDQNTFLLEPVSSENLHNNKSTRNVWCRINGRKLWSVSGRSALQQSELFEEDRDRTELEAGFMWHKVTRVSYRSGISAEVVSYVPHEDLRIECMKVKIQNISDQAMKLQLMTAIPIYGRSADNIRDHRHVTSLLHRIHTTEDGIVVNPTLTFDERGHKKNEMVYGVFAGSEKEKANGFIPLVQDFIGEGGSFENPHSIQEKEWVLAKAGEKYAGYEAIGAIGFEEKTLNPGESRSIYLVMGMDISEEHLLQTANEYLQEERFETELQETKEYWQKKVSVRCFSGDKKFNNWMRWVSFQPILRRLYGCSFLPHHDYGKGGRGWRDLWQDCLALILLDPVDVRRQLFNHFGGVRIDGTNATIIGKKQGEFIADRNNITRVWMDHGMWPMLTTDLYIQQTGDIALLLEKQVYFKDMQISRGEKKDPLWDEKQGNQLRCSDGSVYQGTLLEHLLLQNVTACYDVGEHGYIRLRGADWNDALDMASEHGESVAFTNMYADNLERLAGFVEVLKEAGHESFTIAKEIFPLLSAENDRFADIQAKQRMLSEYCDTCMHVLSGETVEIPAAELAARLHFMGQWMKSDICHKEWIEQDAECGWFNGYYDNHCRRVEGIFDNERRMMLTSQVFSIMSGTASDEQIEKIICAADRYLYRSEAGGYCLNTDFHEVKTDLGRMFGFAYGHKENGAVFCHMAVMYANALYTRNKSAAGYQVLKTLFTHCNDFERSHIYPGIPEYIDARGRGLYHYLTGAASWLLLTVITQMFGIRGNKGDLDFYPQLLAEQFDAQGEAAISFVFAERKLRICYVNKSRKEAGEYDIQCIWVDNRMYNSHKILREDILALSEREEHKIRIELA